MALLAFVPFTLGANETLPVVFMYSLSSEVCMGDDSGWNYRRYFPHYLVSSLNQAAFSQVYSKVYFLSNFKECKLIEEHITSKVSKKVIRVDVADYPGVDGQTARYINASQEVFMGDSGSLWISSASRFFHLHDLMLSKGWKEFVHIEGDNMLYVDSTTLLPHFRANYGTSLAVTPLLGNKSQFTASVFWVGSQRALAAFTSFLQRLAQKGRLWNEYLDWLRPYACCKRGSGLREDSSGRGIKPHKIEEMTMMAFYRHRQESLWAKRVRAVNGSNPRVSAAVSKSPANSPGNLSGASAMTNADRLLLFPVMPVFKYHFNAYTCNMSEFGHGGPEVPPFRQSGCEGGDSSSRGCEKVAEGSAASATHKELSILLYDPGSYGQNIGGTNNKGGRNKGFKDSSHIVGQAMRLNNCVIKMLCGTVSPLHTRLPWRGEEGKLKQDIEFIDTVGGHGNATRGSAKEQCFAAPFVRCGNTAEDEAKEIENFVTQAIPDVQKEAVRRYIEGHPGVKITQTSDGGTGLTYPPTGLPPGDKMALDKNITAALEEKRGEIRAQLRLHSGLTQWHPLYNLHLHAKRTHHYLSSDWPCECREEPYTFGWVHGNG